MRDLFFNISSQAGKKNARDKEKAEKEESIT